MVTDMKCNRKRWSREDREFIEANVGKMTIEEMAEKLKVATTALGHMPEGTEYHCVYTESVNTTNIYVVNFIKKDWIFMSLPERWN